MKKVLLGATIIAALVSPAYASDHMRIVKCEGARNWKECATITLKGELQDSDADEFIERTICKSRRLFTILLAKHQLRALDSNHRLGG
jgi:hypothetical protein